MKEAQIEFMIRVKLPSSAAFHCSPSGDTEYQDAYDTAIKEATPAGYAIIANMPTVKDTDGMTWMRVRCTESDPKNLVNYYIQELKDTRARFTRFVKRLTKVMTDVKVDTDEQH